MSDEPTLPGPWAKQKAALQAAGKLPPSVQAPAPPAPPVIPEEDIPEVGFDRTEEDLTIDNLIDNIGIVEAYNKWCGKMVADSRGRTEGIKVSCPNPNHPDANPSAWLNTQKNTWYCGSCEQGGDVYDIAAWHFGYDVPGYKQGHDFGKLRQEIAESQGYVFQATPTGGTVYKAEEEPKEEAIAEVVHIYEDDDGDDFDITVFPELNWPQVLGKGPGNTFLDVWMNQTKIDDVTEEYHFWNGMIALSMAMGREVTLFDSRPVYSNLFVCIVGTTGSGKSKAKHHLDSLIEKALPYDPNQPLSRGAFRAATPASAEALIWLFKKEIFDPSDPKKSLGYAPVRGIVDYNELSSLIGRANRQGNVLIPALMQFYDCERIVQTVSRTHGLDRAEDPFASVITTTQPDSLKKLLSVDDATSGFVNRWLFVNGKPKERVAIGGAAVDVVPAVKPLQDVHGWAGKPKTIEWSTEAMTTFSQFFASHIAPIQAADKSGILSRIDLLMKKLVLLFTANLKQDIVGDLAVKQAIACWDYILKCYAVPRQQIGNTLQIEVKEEIIRIMQNFEQKFKRGISMRELHQRTNKKKWPDDIVNKTIKHLEMFDLLDISTTPKSGPGRKTRRYRYVG